MFLLWSHFVLTKVYQHFATGIFIIKPYSWNYTIILISLNLIYIKLKTVAQFSHSVMSDSLWPHGLQYARPSCPSPTPGAYSNTCPLSWWCHPTISSSVVPFSSCLKSVPHQGLFKWVCSSHQVAKVLAFQLQHQSFKWVFRTDFL